MTTPKNVERTRKNPNECRWCHESVTVDEQDECRSIVHARTGQRKCAS